MNYNTYRQSTFLKNNNSKLDIDSLDNIKMSSLTESPPMSWEMYEHISEEILKIPNIGRFRGIQTRIAIMLLALARVRVSELLMLKVSDLIMLQKDSFIEINQRGFRFGYSVRTENQREVIQKCSADISYLNKVKDLEDYIFTSNIDDKKPMRRETLTRILNKTLSIIARKISPKLRLTTSSFLTWGKKKMMKPKTNTNSK